jgi:hypothetical protein
MDGTINKDKAESSWTVDRVTASEAARRLGVSPQAVAKSAERHGVKKGVDGKYDWTVLHQAVEEGRAADKSNPSGDRYELMVRKLDAESRLLEIKARILEGEAVMRSAVSLAWSRIAGNIRAEVMAIGAKVGPRCEGQPAAVCIQLINDAANDALRHLAEEPEIKEGK